MRSSIAILGALVFIVFNGAGCAGLGDVVLTDGGSRVLVSANQPAADCQNKGPVIGETRGASTTSAGEHVRRALDDARNKAAALGANYVQTSAPQLTQSQYGPTGATVLGTAFVCHTATAPAVAPAASSPTAPTP